MSSIVSAALSIASCILSPAQGTTEIIESSEIRDHTQRLLKSLKGDIVVKKNK